MPETYTVEQVTRNLRHLGDHLKSGRILAWPSSSMPSAAQVAYDAAAMIADLAEQVNEQREAFTKLTAEYEALVADRMAALPTAFPELESFPVHAREVEVGDYLLRPDERYARVSGIRTREGEAGMHVVTFDELVSTDGSGNDRYEPIGDSCWVMDVITVWKPVLTPNR